MPQRAWMTRPTAAGCATRAALLCVLSLPHGAGAVTGAAQPTLAAATAIGGAVSPADLHESAASEVRRALAARVKRLEIAPPERSLRGVDVDMRHGGHELVARPLPQDISPRSRMVVWVDIFQGGVRRGSVLVPVSLQAWETGWVATADLPAGARLQPEMVSPGEIDIARLDSLAWRGQPQGQVLRAPLREGQALLQRQVAASSSVTRGERLDVIHRDRLLEVRLPALALQDGDTGQVVRVRTPSGAQLSTRVIGPSTVEMIR